jgi:hypothetical protein
MNNSEALETLINAGWLTKEEAKKIKEKVAAAAKNEKLEKARAAAIRALTDYLYVLCPSIAREEHEEFIKLSLKDLETGLESEDPIKAFLKSIGVA